MSARTTVVHKTGVYTATKRNQSSILKTNLSLSLSFFYVRSVFFPSPSFEQTRTFLFLPSHAAPRPLLDRFLAAQLLIFLLSPLFFLLLSGLPSLRALRLISLCLSGD